MEAEDLLQRHESKTLEFKRDASSIRPIMKTLSAFSNTAGGTLLLGVEDRTRRVRGISDPLDLEERIMNLATDGISPQILPEVDILPYRSKTLLAVTVFPGALRPYYISRLGREKGAYVRVGSTNRLASLEILAELDRTAHHISFDEQPMPRLTRADLDLDVAKERFANHRKLTSRDLLTLSLTVRENRREVPTIGGVILFGRDRLRSFPDARIRLARFEGKDRSSVLDRAEADADPVLAIEEALAFLRKHTHLGMRILGSRRRDVPEYPPVALREAVINAVVHADYSQKGSPIRIAIFDDRVEIENPGLLPFGLTVDEIRSGVSKLRNRVIGRVFHELGLIEQWGSGIQRMTRSCEELGLQRPELEEIGTHFRVVFRNAKIQVAQTITGTASRILALLGDDLPHSTSGIAKHLSLTTRTVRTHLKRLVETGSVIEIGEGPTDPKRVYQKPRSN